MDFDTTRLGILMSAFLLSYGFSSVLLSGLGDRIAPLRLLTGMMMVWCILMVMMGFTHNYTVMVTLRILLGIAEGPAVSAGVRHRPPHLSAAASGAGHHAVAARDTGRRGDWFSAVDLVAQYLWLAEHLLCDGDADGAGADFRAHRPERGAAGEQSVRRKGLPGGAARRDGSCSSARISG